MIDIKKILLILIVAFICGIFPHTVSAEEVNLTINEPKVLGERITFQIRDIVINPSYFPTYCKSYVAAYKGNKIISIGNKNTRLFHGAAINVEVSVPNIDDADYLKLFIWKSNSSGYSTMQSIISAKTISNPDNASIESFVQQYLQIGLEENNIPFVSEGSTIKISYGDINQSISDLLTFSIINNRANVLCVDDAGLPLDNALFETDLSIVETKVPYARFTISNKTNANDKFGIVVSQANDGVLIKGEPSIGFAGKPYSCQLSGGTSYKLEGQLPGGLNLLQNGLITGTPSALTGETAEFNIIAANGSVTGKRKMTMHILADIAINETLTNEFAHNNFALTIPEGALDNADMHQLSVTSVAPTNYNQYYAPLTSMEVNISLQGQLTESFNKPLKMTLYFNPLSVAENEQPIVAYYDNGWHEVAADINMQAGTAIVSTYHLSCWGIFERNKTVTLSKKGYDGWELDIKYRPDDICIIGKNTYYHKELAQFISERYSTYFRDEYNKVFKKTGSDDNKVNALPQKVTIVIMDSANLDDEGYASSGGYIYLNGNNYEEIGQYYNAIYHELFHLVQMEYVGRIYMWSNLWFTESTADCVAAAFTEQFFMGTSKRNFMALMNYPLTGEWFEDITKCNKKNEYMGTYFIAYLAGDSPYYQETTINGERTILSLGLTSVPMWVGEFYDYLKDNYSNFSDNFSDILFDRVGIKTLAEFAIDCVYMKGSSSPLGSVPVDMLLLNVYELDDSDNYIPQKATVQLNPVGIKVVKIKKANFTEPTPTAYISAATSGDISKAYIKYIEGYKYAGGIGFSAFYPNPLDKNSAINQYSSDDYNYLFITNAGVKNINWYLSLGNLGAFTEKNVVIDFFLMEVEGFDPLDPKYNLTVTASLNLIDANYIGEAECPPMEKKYYGLKPGTTVSDRIFAFCKVGNITVGVAQKDFTFTLSQ